MKTFTLYPPDNPNKKYKVFVPTKTGYKKIEFGQAGASDFTQHKDELRRQRYIMRHKKNENWDDITSAGAWSYWILWNKPSLQASYKDTLQRFNLKPQPID
jgi:hypothetical protein